MKLHDWIKFLTKCQNRLTSRFFKYLGVGTMIFGFVFGSFTHIDYAALFLGIGALIIGFRNEIHLAVQQVVVDELKKARGYLP